MNNITEIPKTFAQKAKEKAEAELKEKKMVEATKKFKLKLEELDKAKKIVSNLENELEELEHELS